MSSALSLEASAMRERSHQATGGGKVLGYLEKMWRAAPGQWEELDKKYTDVPACWKYFSQHLLRDWDTPPFHQREIYAKIIR